MASTEAVEDITTWDPIRLTHQNPTCGQPELALAGRQDIWHKFIIFDGPKYEADEVLKAIILACDTDVLLPVKYRIEDQRKSSFLTKCGSNAIENLVKQGLTTTLSGGHEIHYDIVLGYLTNQDFPLNTNRVIAQALYCRYECAKKVLNLDDFQNEKLLGSIFCPIDLSKVMHFVLRCTKKGVFSNNRDSRLPVRELSLRYNKLTCIILFEKFFNYHLTKLDLRHNNIMDTDYLRYFSEFKISELWLDGNPLCTRYSASQEYIQAVKDVFPYLQKLDGVVIGMEHKFIPSIQSYFLGDGTKINLIKQFVRHYFTLYDQDDRSVMNGLYERDALYSMTLGPLSNNLHKQITKTFVTNRNLLKFVDYAKCQECLLQGPEKIISTLRHQPPTVHNFKSFYIDLLHYGENYVAISVQGLFSYREVNCPPMLFNRTFIIIRKEDDEYCITNDQYYLDGTPTNVIPQATHEPKTAPKFTPIVLSVSEKEQLLTFLHELTTMNEVFCQEYLEESDWNIRTAITKFMKMYTVNDIPPEAFV